MCFFEFQLVSSTQFEKVLLTLNCLKLFATSILTSTTGSVLSSTLVATIRKEIGLTGFQSSNLFINTS